MKRVLLDVNVILDVLLDRKPHAAASAAASAAVENRALEGLLSADAVMTIHYLIARERGAVTARRNISALLGFLGVAAVDDAVPKHALTLSMNDFEDAVTVAAAQASGCAKIVTRIQRT